MSSKLYDFSINEDDNINRHSYRAHVYGIEVRVNKGPRCYNLADISVTGCAFRVSNVPWAIGDKLKIQLEVKGRVILSSLDARLVRITPNNTVACSFDRLTEKQEFALDKLVLEIQKRIIALNRA